MQSRVRTLALFLIGVAIAILFLSRFAPARGLLVVTGRHTAAAAAVVLACIAAGFLGIAIARRFFPGNPGDEHEAIAIHEALLVGFPLFGTLVAAVAWTGVALEPLVMAGTFVAAAAGALLLWRRGPVQLPATLPRVALLVTVPVLLALLEAVTPVNSPDELIYKLAVPQAYRQYGAMLELPLSSHSYATLAPHFTDLAALVLSGGIAAKLARFMLYLATLMAIYRLGRRLGGDGTAWWAVNVVAWTPALAVIAGWAWDEWGVIGLLVLSLERFEAWLDSRTPLNGAIAFAALGGALASKYTAVPWLLAFAVVMLLRLRREPRAIAAAALVTILSGSFFYARNVIWTGSPVAPFLQRDAPPVLSYRTAEPFGGWRELARGAHVFDVQLIDESLGILLPVAVLASLFAIARRERATRDLLLTGALQLPLLLSFAPITHNLAGALVPLAIVGTSVLVTTGLAWRAIAVIGLTAQLVLAVFILHSYDVLPYLAGAESEQQYLARTRNFTKPFDFIHTQTASSSRILLLGETRTFYLERETLAGGNLDGPRIAAFLAQFRTPAALAEGLHRLGATHVLLRRSGYRVDDPSLPPLNVLERETMLVVPPQTDAVLMRFLKSGTLLRYRDADYLVFEVR